MLPPPRDRLQEGVEDLPLKDGLVREPDALGAALLHPVAKHRREDLPLRSELKNELNNQ